MRHCKRRAIDADLRQSGSNGENRLRVLQVGQLTVKAPALLAWRRRSDWTTRDALWLCACWEVRAAEAAAAGLGTDTDALQRAREILAVRKPGSA